MTADWSRKFDEPIALPKGRQLATLKDAGTYITKLPKGSALRAVRPPNLHITPVARRDLVYRASATGSLYRSPLAIMAQTIRAILLASAIAATLVGRRASKAVSAHFTDGERRFQAIVSS